MSWARFTLVVITGGWLAACATPARQTEALLRGPPDIPRHSEIKNVPFINQSAGYCGPATLTMAMNYQGTAAVMEDIAKETYTPGHKGSLQENLVGATRRQGLMAVPIQGLDSLLREIAAGQPVVIFENLGFSWYTNWHYAIVTGYDLDRPEVIMHSGPEPNKHWDMRHFERSWEYSNYWGLVVLKPGDLAVAASELAHLTSAAALEQLGNSSASESAYRSILKQWPQSLGALIGLGNVAYARGDRSAAIQYLKTAVQFHPKSEAARHNLAIAQAAEVHPSPH